MGAKDLLEQAPEVKVPDPAFGTRQPLPPKYPEAPTLPPEMVPDGIRTWLTDAANRACLPLEMLAVPAIVALSGLIGRSVCIKPRAYSDWTVIPNLWGAIVAPPGTKKSDSIAEALRPLGALESKSRVAYQTAILEAKAEQALLKAQLQSATQRAKKGMVTKTDIADLPRQLEEQTLPEKRYSTTDATPEKLGELLRDNPRGITVVRDELASWIASMESQDSAVSRGFFLAAWNGFSGYTFDRIGRGTTHIPAACVSIIGGIQPLPLQATFDRLRRDSTRADGLLQRFQLFVWPDAMPPWNPPQDWPDQKARDRAYEIFGKLDVLEFRTPDTGGLEPYPLEFTDDAGKVFTEWHDAHEQRLRATEWVETPHFAAHIAKYGSLVASLAVVFHLVDFAADFANWAFNNERWEALNDIPKVDLEATLLALDWAEFLELHSRKVYGPELNGSALAAHALAQQIERGDIVDGQTLREIQRSSRLWADRERLDEALHILEGLEWLKVLEVLSTPQGGRPSEIIRLHPELRGKR